MCNSAKAYMCSTPPNANTSSCPIIATATPLTCPTLSVPRACPGMFPYWKILLFLFYMRLSATMKTTLLIELLADVIWFIAISSLKNSVFQIDSTGRNFSEAHKFCEFHQVDAEMVKVRSQHENDFIVSILSEFKLSAWIGLTCLDQDPNNCDWDDYTKIRDTGYSNFVPGCKFLCV